MNQNEITYHRNFSRNYYKKLKDKLFGILGGKKCTCKDSLCICHGMCNVEDERCLQFDHINGGGRQSYKINGPYKMWKYYADNPEIANKELRVLCSNYNSYKKHIKKEFPFGNKNAKRKPNKE